MDHDDHGLGRVLTRREVLALLGATTAMWAIGCRTEPPGSRTTSADAPASSARIPGCVVRPEQTEGPYFVDERLNRSDLTRDPTDGAVKEGVPLALSFEVSRMGSSGCTPLAGAVVDVWHCDGLGAYSDVRDPHFDTTGKKFLRGYQVTDAQGRARFASIYPGWYPGRTVHVHFKIRSAPEARPGFEFTSQLYFDDALTDRVHERPPYATKGRRTLRNDQDGIFAGGGSELMLALTPAGVGYSSTFPIALALA